MSSYTHLQPLVKFLSCAWVKKNLRTAVCIAGAMGLCAVAVQADDNYVTAGSAYNLENNALIYRELYTSINESKEVRVDYVTPDGALFASKTLVYAGELFQPSFTFKDQRDNEIISAQFQGARLVVRHGMGVSTNEKTIMNNARVVVDAGFDSYIQLNWDKLLSGKSARFEFLMPTRLATLTLEAKKLKPKDSPLYDAAAGAQWVYFRLAPAQKLLSLFSDAVYLAYDPNGRYLMRFQGRSNIDDDRGGPLDVRIEYEYMN
jgi:hypothetical protein